MNIKNSILAIPAALAAIPPKPKTAATSARIINVTVQRNIIIYFLGLYIIKIGGFPILYNKDVKNRNFSLTVSV